MYYSSPLSLSLPPLFVVVLFLTVERKWSVVHLLRERVLVELHLLPPQPCLTNSIHSEIGAKTQCDMGERKREREKERKGEKVSG